jgi:hypothetical protein
MKKRQFLVLGLLALFLVLITGFTGCDSETSYANNWIFYNQSSYTIQVNVRAGYDVSPRSFSLRPGSSQKIGSNTNSRFDFDWYRTDTGNQTGVSWNSNTHTFYNR